MPKTRNPMKFDFAGVPQTRRGKKKEEDRKKKKPHDKI